jgi:hypothetical protein
VCDCIRSDLRLELRQKAQATRRSRRFISCPHSVLLELAGLRLSARGRGPYDQGRRPAGAVRGGREQGEGLQGKVLASEFEPDGQKLKALDAAPSSIEDAA